MTKKQSVLLIGISGLIFIILFSGKYQIGIQEKIILMERAAKDRWGNGDPWGYLEIYADEITYFDPGKDLRVDGLKAMKELLAPIKGKIQIERYDMINPKVQLHGNTAVLTFNVINYIRTPEDSLKEVRWNCTEVYSQIKGEWKIIHSHWSHPPQHKQPE